MIFKMCTDQGVKLRKHNIIQEDPLANEQIGASFSTTTSFWPKLVLKVPVEYTRIVFSLLEYFRTRFCSLTDKKYCLV